MPTDDSVLRTLAAAFAGVPRPDHFISNYFHCDECAEHDLVLRSRDRETLSIDDVGNAGWDPICFISPEGFAYFLPSLARLALDETVTAHRGWYGEQLLFHLLYDGAGNARILYCSPGQRAAVVNFLNHLVDTRAGLADAYQCSDALLRAIDNWSEGLSTPGLDVL